MSNILLDDLITNTVNIALPTRGAFYTNLNEGFDPMEVPVKHLSVIEESLLNDPVSLVSGKSINKLVKRVVDNIIDANDLCEIDVQAILVACRIASYGNNLKLNHTCECEEENVLDIDLNDLIMRFEPLTDEEIERYSIKLGNGQTVHLRPITYGSTTKITLKTIRENNEERPDSEDMSDEMIDFYHSKMVSALETNINAVEESIFYVTTQGGSDVYDRGVISEWMQHITRSDFDLIIDRMDELKKRFAKILNHTYQCGCGKKHIIASDLDFQKLFTQAGEQKVEKSSSAEKKSTPKSTKKSSRILRK